ncbi:hypothetical protein CJD36_014150 [Flavipsychrobacter stenotrophus]|uniref:Uncharacterized protein n=1 Tax=Flavipsychrobacter stenotrophus TaxID=2077091 RepID=A0A2S7SX53_9BACT|nr:ankyrin repeat domain-containing protein [Flavipsychrobacter stenotrophus]PQJ11106.1 hypothetical protein CJD36_014150 [Flavipsychrobacter stenotrophus]
MGLLDILKGSKQKTLDKELIDAITAKDTAAAIGALEKGADCNAKAEGSAEKLTVLIMSSANGCKEVVQLLVTAGAKVDQPDSAGMTALMWASKHGNSDIIEILLRKGADVDRKSETGYTPLLYATEHGQLGTIRILLARGAVVECKDKQNTTPIMIAAQHGFTEIAALLLQHGADKNYKGLHGKSAMDFARTSTRTDVLDMFLTRN